MAAFRLHQPLPALTSPVLVVMLGGWIDASGAAAAAMAVIEAESDARTIATFDRDTFIDYRARRPIMELRDGLSTRLVWPDTELKVGTDRSGHDVLLLTGYEPDSSWNLFADAVTSLCIELGVRMMIGIGAFPFASPHTRQPRLSSTSPDPSVVASHRLLKNSVDVPAGMEAVLEHAFAAKGIPAMGIWAQVPHYVSAMSYPAATVALLSAIAEVGDVVIDGAECRGEALIQRQRLDELVDANAEHRAMVRQLESVYDAQEETGQFGHPSGVPHFIDASLLPSAEELAAEFEQFLRDQDD
jgi:PAC2 family